MSTNRIINMKLVYTAALILALAVGYANWAPTRCQSTLTATGLPCPRAMTHKDGWCDVHQPMEAARIEALIRELRAR